MTDTGTQRRLVHMPLDQIEPAARNPRQHDEAGIRRSISTFGLADLPVLDERTGRLVSGHGRVNDLVARYTAGENPPDGVEIADTGEWLVPVIRGWASRSDADAEAYLVAANQLTIRGGWDQAGLEEILADLANTDLDLLTVTTFTEDDLARLASSTPDMGATFGTPDAEPPDDFPEYGDDIPTEHTCPACGYQWSGGSGSKAAR